MSLQSLREAVPRLHGVIGAEVVGRLSGVMETRKGKPSAVLEDLPSPVAFRTLRTLCGVMLEVGGVDVWTGLAVEVVKGMVRERVFEEEGRKEYYVRNEFDDVYLRVALGVAVADLPLGVEEGTKKAAVEYWGRTRLLFGVLDP